MVNFNVVDVVVGVIIILRFIIVITIGSDVDVEDFSKNDGVI